MARQHDGEEHSMTTQVPMDEQKVMQFVLRLVADVTAANMSTLVYIGDRNGLFKALAEGGPTTVDSLAERTGQQPRYLREWLSAMACAHYVDYDAASQRFTLPAEHAACLVNEDSPAFVGGMFQMLPTFGHAGSKVAESFKQGGGVPQTEYGEEFWKGFERFTRAQFVNKLAQVWIPAMPEVEAALNAGGSVADIGCGNGQALLILAGAYPKARYTGFDNYQLAIDNANQNARAAGLEKQVQFELRDIVDGMPEQYDLITTFDVVHDMVRPRAALKAIRQALKPGGTYLWLEFNVSSDLAENIGHPFGLPAFIYSASTLYCMTTSLSQGGEGLGAALGEAKARELAEEAGFSHFRRLPLDDPFSLLMELKA
jgi:SAM-dependent methyltransferase